MIPGRPEASAPAGAGPFATSNIPSSAFAASNPVMPFTYVSASTMSAGAPSIVPASCVASGQRGSTFACSSIATSDLAISSCRSG